MVDRLGQHLAASMEPGDPVARACRQAYLVNLLAAAQALRHPLAKLGQALAANGRDRHGILAPVRFLDEASPIVDRQQVDLVPGLDPRRRPLLREAQRRKHILDVFALRFTPDAPAASRDQLRAEASQLALEVVPLDRIQGAISDALGRIFGLFDALAAVAVLIAALGIVNTLTMNVVERVREIGILRAAGMTRDQVWRSVVVEAGVLGLAGALLGIALGLVVGGLMVVLAGGRVDVGAGIPWPIIGLALVLGVVVAMLAAAYPARLASRLSIVRAVQYE